jgi:hypothetical protein
VNATTASSATAATNSFFGRDDSLPVHQLDIDAGVSLGAIGASSSETVQMDCAACLETI